MKYANIYEKCLFSIWVPKCLLNLLNNLPVFKAQMLSLFIKIGLGIQNLFHIIHLTY